MVPGALCKGDAGHASCATFGGPCPLSSPQALKALLNKGKGIAFLC